MDLTGLTGDAIRNPLNEFGGVAIFAMPLG